MSLDVKHINGDSTFLLTFSAASTSASQSTADGAFRVLLDPWLSGESHIFHPKFALAKLTIPSSVQHLSEIPTPDVVIVSQDRTDHCHEGTLRQLDPNLPHTVILAHPAAAKRIRGWKYFDNSKVHALSQFSARKSNTVIRFRIPSVDSSAVPGEATISFINAKFDMTGTHNAVGFTYRPPAPAPLIASPLPSPAFSVFSPLQTSSSAFDIRSRYQSMPPTPPRSPPQSADGSKSSSPGFTNISSPDLSLVSSVNTNSTNLLSPTSLQVSHKHQHTRSNSSQNFSRPLHLSRDSNMSTDTPESSSDDDTLHNLSSEVSNDTCPTSPAWTNISTRSYTPFRPKTLSVIYSPHGLNYQSIRPYVTSHLISNAALPLTLLLHSFDRIQNPWYLGGNVNAGSPGGLEIARNLLAKSWISAHDEDKESSGIAVLKVVTRKYTASEVAEMLHGGQNSKKDKKGGYSKVSTDVRVLDVGESTVLS